MPTIHGYSLAEFDKLAGSVEDTLMLEILIFEEAK